MNKYILILGFIFYSVTNVTAQNTTSDFLANNYEVQFLKSTGVSGTIVFKIYAYGRNQDQAVQNAKSDALKAVMFKGIPGSDLKDPMITDLSVIETQKAFFTTFLKLINTNNILLSRVMDQLMAKIFLKLEKNTR
jgi:hypothetical protein